MTPHGSLRPRDFPGVSGHAEAPACADPAERGFYAGYDWALNPLLDAAAAASRLAGELDRLVATHETWQRDETLINVHLLACGLLTAADDALHGPAFRLPQRLAQLPGARLALRVAAGFAAAARAAETRRLRRWRGDWRQALAAYLRVFVAGPPYDAVFLKAACDGLAVCLRAALPRRLAAEPVRIPSAFRKQDLTHFDALALARGFTALAPDRARPVVVVGLRTAGGYFAPLMQAWLAEQGFARVAAMTLRPGQGLSGEEKRQLRRFAADGCRAALIDDPPFSGDTLGMGVAALRAAGFDADSRTVLFPVHPLRRDWREHKEAAGFANETIVTLAPEDWFKARLLESEAAASRLAEYFPGAAIIEHPMAAAFNAELADRSGDSRRLRLKRVHALRLPGGETRFVLAKSVGWGWYGYAAFLATERLAGLVPPLIGLRDGILYSEWIPQTKAANSGQASRESWIAAAAAYAAARAERLPVASPGAPDAQAEGLTLLAETLAAAYGPGVSGLMAAPLRRRLAARLAPKPALIDGRMAAAEWIAGPAGLLKTDFEHHGIGKNELNLCDPGFDLADAILQFGLDTAEERDLIARYAAATGDAPQGERLFLCKLLAGLWSRRAALDGLLKQPHLVHRAGEFHAQAAQAWDFLTRESARHCGAYLPPQAPPVWGAKLAVLDLDGVVDRRIFGFPSTTAAGIAALALLRAGGFTLALDTARSVREVRDYCAAYGFAGGVAECGGYIWDAVTGTGRGLVGDAAMEQLAELRAILRGLPGVFLHDGHDYSIRAYTYTRNGTAPLPALMVRTLIAARGFDRLACRQTTIDTAVTAIETDKGAGLRTLLDRTGQTGADTIAVGDSETDLPMFRAAKRSFAPAHIDCANLARALGCAVAEAPFQRGLLEIARRVTGSGEDFAPASPKADLYWDLLRAADRPRAAHLWRALGEPDSWRVFRG